MSHYRRKPVEVDAIQWTGGNYSEVYRWVKQWGLADPGIMLEGERINVSTVDGGAHVDPGEWLIYGENELFYSMTADDFAATHEPCPQDA